MSLHNPFASVDEVSQALSEHGYVANTALATAVFLSLQLERPLLLEGEPGVGKTEVAKVLATILDRPFVRLQCYEGIERESALYDWNYARQLLHIRVFEATQDEGAASADARQARLGLEADLFSRDYLLRRPLLEAVAPDGPAPVLLIDELDRSDEAFEAFLLELLAEFQVSIPELGTLAATEIPCVIVTSNRTREIHDALKRRCLFHWIDYPDFATEYRIVRQRVPGLPEELAAQICSFIADLRQQPLFKLPGVAETIAWAESLQALGARRLDPAVVEQTLGSLLKYRDDLELLRRPRATGTELQRLVADSARDGK